MKTLQKELKESDPIHRKQMEIIEHNEYPDSRNTTVPNIERTGVTIRVIECILTGVVYEQLVCSFV